MQKIMFDDRYDLTNLVIAGRKTTTRRLETCLKDLPQNQPILRVDQYGYDTVDDKKFLEIKIGGEFGPWWYTVRPYLHMLEEVAVAMRYRDVNENRFLQLEQVELTDWYWKLKDKLGKLPNEHMGWGNKQSVLPDMMPYRIYIDNIRVEHLQDISDTDCLREGIQVDHHTGIPTYYFRDTEKGIEYHYNSPREAFANLINKEGGAGTWESNRLVIVYDFHTIGTVKF